MGLCACGCERDVRRRTALRHLAGKGTKSALTIRERNLRRQRLRFNRKHPHAPRQRIPTMDLNDDLPDINIDIDSSEPWAGSPSSSPERMQSPSCTATNLGLKAVWRATRISATDDEGDADTEASNDDEFLGGLGDSSDEEDGLGDDGFPPVSRLQGMSAVDILNEAFEAEAAHRGTSI